MGIASYNAGHIQTRQTCKLEIVHVQSSDQVFSEIWRENFAVDTECEVKVHPAECAAFRICPSTAALGIKPPVFA